MNELFVDTAEMIAFLQFKAQESKEHLDQIKRKIWTHQGNLSIDSKVKLLAVIENLEPEIIDAIQSRIYEIRKLNEE